MITILRGSVGVFGIPRAIYPVLIFLCILCAQADELGSVRLGPYPVGGIEGKTAEITILRDIAGNLEFPVVLRTEDGSAVEGVDFLGRSFEAVFRAGQSFLTISIPLPNNGFFDGPRSFVVKLDAGANADHLGYPSEALVTINDDDAAPSTGAVDRSFQPSLDLLLKPFSSIAVQKDGKILAAAINPYANQPLLFRFNPDGSADSSFPILYGSGAIQKITVIGDKIMLGTSGLTTSNGFQGSLIRLNSDGSFDQTFAFTNNWSVGDFIVLSDRTLLVTASQPNPGAALLVHLLANGEVSSDFHLQVDGLVASYGLGHLPLAIQKDGKILIGGQSRTLFSGQSSTNSLVRFNADGSLDSTFNFRVFAIITALAMQADGRILAGTATNLLRLRADGSLDPTFVQTWHGAIAKVFTLDNNKILIAGSVGVDRKTAEPLLLLDENGNPDSSFAPDFAQIGYASLTVNDFAFAIDGRLVVAGGFASVDENPSNGIFIGSPRANLVRFHFNDDPFQLTTPHIDASGTLLKFKGGSYREPFGTSYVVEESHDLLDWLPVLTNQVSGPAAVVSLPLSASQTNHFFRLQRR